jgi:hypothetical protein
MGDHLLVWGHEHALAQVLPHHIMFSIYKNHLWDSASPSSYSPSQSSTAGAVDGPNTPHWTVSGLSVDQPLSQCTVAQLRRAAAWFVGSCLQALPLQK